MARFESMTLSELPSGIWRTRLPVRFGSCDPAGIVYTPEYLNLFNGVIEDWYGDALGLPYHELVGTRRTGLGYAHVSADHKSIALPDDMRLALKNYQANCDASASVASTDLRYGSSSGLPA